MINPVECSNKQCGVLYCSACIEYATTRQGEKTCKSCLIQVGSYSVTIFIQSTYEKPSQVILKILLSYQVSCSFCHKAFSLKEIG